MGDTFAVIFLIVLRSVIEFFRSVRETWIKAKYVEKAFVKQTTLPSSVEKCSSAVTSPAARQWSVYKRKRKPTVNESTTASIAAENDSSATKGYQ